MEIEREVRRLPEQENLRSAQHEISPREMEDRKRSPVGGGVGSPSRSQSRSRSPSRRKEEELSPRGRVRSGPQRPNPSPSNVLGVFGLSHYTRQRDLEDIFSKFGPVKEVSLVMDRRSNQSRGFGFIYFDSVEDSQKALEETNGMRLDGRYIRVDYSATQRPHSPTPGKYMGERRDSRERRGFDRRDRERDRDVDRRRYYRSRSPRRRSRSRDRYFESRDRYSNESRDYRDSRAPREDRDPRMGRDSRSERDSRSGRDFREDHREPRLYRDNNRRYSRSRSR